jgi:hypothetical protein
MEPRRYPTSFGEGWSKKGRLLILPGEPSVQASRRSRDTSSATYSTRRREISSRTCSGMTKQAIQEARATNPSEIRSEIAIVIHKKNGKRTCSRLSSLRMLADCSSLSRSGLSLKPDWNFGQTNILHDGPNNREARRLGCEGVNLIGALPHIAKQALNRVGGADVAMHDRRKGIKGQQMVLLLAETADCFRIALAIFAECSLRG